MHFHFSLIFFSRGNKNNIFYIAAHVLPTRMFHFLRSLNQKSTYVPTMMHTYYVEIIKLRA